jgi:hypothetical protein
MEALAFGTAECQQAHRAVLTERHQRHRADARALGAEQEITLRVTDLATTRFAGREQRFERADVGVFDGQLAQERAEFRSKKKSIYFEVKEEAQDSCREMTEALIATGRVRNMPVERITGVMGDLLYGTMFTNFLTGRRRPYDQQARDILDVVFNGILSDAERKR